MAECKRLATCVEASPGLLPFIWHGRGGRPHRNSPELAPYFLDWLVHPSYDDYWKQVSIEEHFSRITVPIFHIGAWYDVFLGGTLRNYWESKRTVAARRRSGVSACLLWSVDTLGPGPRIGEVDFGLDSVVNVDDLALRWYDYLLKGEEMVWKAKSR